MVSSKKVELTLRLAIVKTVLPFVDLIRCPINNFFNSPEKLRKIMSQFRVSIISLPHVRPIRINS